MIIDKIFGVKFGTLFYSEDTAIIGLLLLKLKYARLIDYIDGIALPFNTRFINTATWTVCN